MHTEQNAPSSNYSSTNTRRWDWAGVLPTQKLLESSLVTPENPPSVQELFMIFSDWQADTQTPYTTNHHTTLYRYGGGEFLHHFSTSHKMEWASIPHFVRIKVIK